MQAAKYAALLWIIAATLVSCSKSGGLLGSYAGVGHLAPYQQQYMQDLSPEAQKHMAESAANMRGQLVLNADGSATESNNYKGGHSWTGTWTRSGETIKVAMAGGPSDTFTESSDGKTLTSSHWTFTKQ